MSRKAHINPDKCLNCGEELHGRYCARCGQDSEEHLDSIWHLIKHFFEDITHYDGKLWKTVKPLLIRPGFLTQEYLAGRRASYIQPVRMFIFLNFIFFFLLLSLPSTTQQAEKYQGYEIGKSVVMDSVPSTLGELDTADRELLVGHVASIKIRGQLMTGAQHDSVQRTLPPDKRHWVMTNHIIAKVMDLFVAMSKDPDALSEKINEVFFHNAAKLTFLFLVVCTCILAMLYYRQRIFMIDHALFTIHLVCTFLFLSVFMLLFSYLSFGVYLNTAIFLYGNYYFYRALRSVYRQPAWKTIFKFMIINFFLLLSMALGLALNALFAIMSV